jgi:cytochrome c oxidase subunit 2
MKNRGRNGFNHRMISLAFCLLWPTLTAASDKPVIAPAKFVYCSVCHGMDLKGNRNIQATRLSGMEAWYVSRQLEAFSKGWRGTHDADLPGIEMRPMAEALSAAEIDEAAHYVASVSSPMPIPTIQGDVARGASLYPSCGACHGSRAEGNQSLGGPALTTQNDWYLVTQLRNYRNGNRGQHAEDTYGQQMRAAAQLLAGETAILDVVAYISTMQPKEEN